MENYKIKYEEDNLAVIEMRPHVRTIAYEQSYFRLSLPYSVFVLLIDRERRSYIDVDGMYSYFAYEPVESPESPLYSSLLPNMGGGIVCRGSGVPIIFDSDCSLDEIVRKTLEGYWCSKFNSECGLRCSLTEWQDNTKKNPEFWKELRNIGGYGEQLGTKISDWARRSVIG